MSTSRAEQLTTSITQRLADLLEAQVVAFDERGCVLASANRSVSPEPDSVALRAQIELNGRPMSLLVRPPTGDWKVSDRLMQAFADLLAEQAALVHRIPKIDQLKYRFIHSLLQGELEDEDHISREAQILGMDLSRPRSVILIDAAAFIFGGGSTDLAGRKDLITQQRAQTVITSVVRFFSLPNATICAYIGNGEVAVLKASGTQDLLAWADSPGRADPLNPSWGNLAALKRAGAALLTRLQTDVGSEVSIGIGRYHPGLQGLAWSYRDSRIALDLGRRVQAGARVYCLDSLGAAAFVGLRDEATKAELARHLLTPLDQDPDLLATLQAFFSENCSPSQCSRRLSIHRNTLSYRLDKIASLTGLDPRQFDQAVQIRLALMLRSFTSSSASDLEPVDL